MAVDRLIPLEILDQIFFCLPINDVYRCLTVSKHWYSIAIIRLYCYCPDYVPSRQDDFKLFKRHRTHIRHISWTSIPPIDHHFQEICDLVLLEPGDIGESVKAKASIASGVVGPLRRSTIKTMFFKGRIMHDTVPSFYDFLSWIPSLTRLEMSFTVIYMLPAAITPNNASTSNTDCERIQLWTLLDNMPQLQHLSLTGCVYEPWPENRRQSSASLESVYSLKTFLHSYELLEAIDPQVLLPRLPYLEHLCIVSSIHFRHSIAASFYDPIAFAQTLQESCPRVRGLSVINWLPLCLFLPSFETNIDLDAGAGSFQTRQIGPLPALPCLTSIECTGESILSSEDFNHFYRLQHLVHLDISVRRNYIQQWPEGNRSTTKIQGRDIQRLLEACPNLKVFLAVGRHIHLQDMLQDNDDTGMLLGARNITQEESYISDAAASTANDTQNALLRPWACESVLETLAVGLVLSTTELRLHNAVWAQLGRLVRLEQLHLDKSNLIPSIHLGMKHLERLKRLRVYRNSRSPWPFPDKETVIWLATKCCALKQIVVESDLLRARTLTAEMKGWLESVGRLDMWTVSQQMLM